MAFLSANRLGMRVLPFLPGRRTGDTSVKLEELELDALVEGALLRLRRRLLSRLMRVSRYSSSSDSRASRYLISSNSSSRYRRRDGDLRRIGRGIATSA